MNFLPVHNLLFGIILILLNLGIFIKAKKIFNINKDPKMALISAGFLWGGIFELFHILYSFTYGNSDKIQLYTLMQFVFLLFSNIFSSFSILISIFWVQTEIEKKSFKINNIYSIFSIAALFIILLVEALNFVPVNDSYIYYFINNIFVFNPAVEVIDNAIYILSAFLLFNIRSINNKKPFSLFITGLLILGIFQLYIFLPEYLYSYYRFFVHIAKFIGLLLLYLGLKDINFEFKYLSFRTKFTAYPSLFIIFVFWLNTSIYSFVTNTHFAIYFSYIILVFFIIAVILTFVLADSLIKPISLLIEKVNNLDINAKPEEIDVRATNEIGILTQKFNEKSKQIWLYTQELQLSYDREKLFKKITENIRNTLDINQTKQNIVNTLGEICGADRCFMLDFDNDENFLSIGECCEYLKNNNQKSLIGVDLEEYNFEYWAYIFKKDKKEIAISDVDRFIEENKLQNSKIENYSREFSFKAGIAYPIFINDKITNIIVINFSKAVELSPDKIDYIKSVINQLAIALNQSRIYEDEKRTAAREFTLRRIIEVVRSTMDIDIVKKLIVEEICKTFNSDRCFFRTYDKNTRKLCAPDVEYVSSTDVATLAAYSFSDEANEYLLSFYEQGKAFIIQDVEKFLKTSQNEDINTILSDHFVKSSYGFPIFMDNEFFATFAIHYTKNKVILDADEIELLKTIANQVGIAIKQAEMFSNIKQQAEKEKFIRNILEKSTSTFEIAQIKQLVRDVGQITKADRCYFVEVDLDDLSGKAIDNNAEYLSSNKIKSIVGYKFLKKDVKKFIEIYLTINDLYVFDYEKIRRENNPDYEGIINYSKLFNLKSGVGIPFFYINKLIGVLAIEYVNEKVLPTNVDLDFLRIIGNQIGIAYNQSQLYQNIKQIAEKEKYLREIVSNIKLSQTLDEMYNYLLTKLAKIFQVPRIFFVEIIDSDIQSVIIKYEYVSNTDAVSFKNEKLPAICHTTLYNMAKTTIPVCIENTYKYHPEDEEVQEFFNKHNLKSVLAHSLIQKDKININIPLGTFVMCSPEINYWDSYKKELFQEIIEACLQVIWENIKRREIDELRDTFILTLAHDLEVPVIGERRALEFLMSLPPEQILDKFKTIISEIIINNITVTNFLKKLVDSYNYELNRKNLYFAFTDINQLLLEVIKSQKIVAESKSINLEYRIQKEIPDIYVDRDEIKKAITTLIENAIIYTQLGGKVEITCSLKLNNIVICTIDNGPGIPRGIQKKLFKRFEMTQLIERKIGSGLGLYLAKQIVEAHKGRIWFISDIDKGTTFCIALPVLQEQINV